MSMLDDVQEFYPTCWSDFRGDIWTTYDFKKNGITHKKLTFNHDKFSSSRKNVLRGIHGDFKTWKLITCVYGEVYVVVVDNRPNSKSYKQWHWWILSGSNKLQLLLPPGFGNGHYVLSEQCVFHYKLSYKGDYVDANEQFTIRWNDPDIGIIWPVTDPMLSERDRA